MRPLSIAIISHLKYPIKEPFAGGLEMHTHLLARHLIKRGHKVKVFATTHTDPSIGVEAICDATELENVGTEEARDIVFFKEHHAYLNLMMRLRKSDFDIIHNNSLHYLVVSLADTVPMPMVTVLHTPPFCWLESGIRCAFTKNNHFIAISEKIKNMWSPVMPIERVIPNGIDLNNFPFQEEASPESYAIWYGRIVPEKGLHFAIDAAKIAGIKLKFAGPIANQEYYNQKILPRLTDDTQYLGHMAHEELAKYIAHAKVTLCTPCWEEPFGLVLVESLACGVPVAGFKRGALPEIITDDCGALAEENDAKGLAEAVTKAIKCKRSQCRARAKKIANSETMISQYENFYYTILKEQQNLAAG